MRTRNWQAAHGLSRVFRSMRLELALWPMIQVQIDAEVATKAARCSCQTRILGRLSGRNSGSFWQQPCCRILQSIRERQPIFLQGTSKHQKKTNRLLAGFVKLQQKKPNSLLSGYQGMANGLTFPGGPALSPAAYPATPRAPPPPPPELPSLFSALES
jgi:hypothetical protein